MDSDPNPVRSADLIHIRVELNARERSIMTSLGPLFDEEVHARLSHEQSLQQFWFTAGLELPRGIEDMETLFSIRTLKV